jgi:hypothetical protein
MRLMFVHYLFEDRGSAQDIQNFAVAARDLGHEVAIYGPPKENSPFNYSMDLESSDAMVFILEWTADLQEGDALDWLRMVARLPKRRRVVIDCDGKYNDAISVVGDYNHESEEQSRRWIQICDALSDKIFQPTQHPLRANVRTFFFHAYSPEWEVPLSADGKEYSMYYVGHNWFRWRSMKAILQAIEPVRDQLRRLGIVGHGWDRPAPWANQSIIKDAYYSDPEYLRQLRVETFPPILFGAVIENMSKGVFMPVIYRPLFNHLRLVTCRTFETIAANTIPLFGMDESCVKEFYGEGACELVMPRENPHEKILDMVTRPEHYASIVAGIRAGLAKEHSYHERIRQLIRIIEQ